MSERQNIPHPQSIPELANESDTTALLAGDSLVDRLSGFVADTLGKGYSAVPVFAASLALLATGTANRKSDMAVVPSSTQELTGQVFKTTSSLKTHTVLDTISTIAIPKNSVLRIPHRSNVGPTAGFVAPAEVGIWTNCKKINLKYYVIETTGTYSALCPSLFGGILPPSQPHSYEGEFNRPLHTLGHKIIESLQVASPVEELTTARVGGSLKKITAQYECPLNTPQGNSANSTYVEKIVLTQQHYALHHKQLKKHDRRQNRTTMATVTMC